MIAFTTHTKSESCEEHSRICFSCSKKGLFNVQERHVLEWRRASFCSKFGLSMKREGHENWNILTITVEMFSVLLLRWCVLFLTEEHRITEHTKVRKIAAPPPAPAGPSPGPSPEGKGSNHRDTPMGWMKAALASLLVSSLAVTLCDICMPKAFCGFETVRQNAPWTLCALWEKNLSTHTYNVLFLTE